MILRRRPLREYYVEVEKTTAALEVRTLIPPVKGAISTSLQALLNRP